MRRGRYFLRVSTENHGVYNMLRSSILLDVPPPERYNNIKGRKPYLMDRGVGFFYLFLAGGDSIMKASRIIRAVLTFLLFASFSLYGTVEEKVYSPKDIQPIMKTLLEYHVDYDDLSRDLLERSFRIYFKQFDPEGIYFFQDEISKYFHPSDALLDKSFHEYKKGNVAVFHDINVMIQRAIIRARDIRHELRKKLPKIYSDARRGEMPFVKKGKDIERWPETEEGLKEKAYSHLVSFVKYHLVDKNEQFTEKNRDKVFELYDRQKKSAENEYLYLSHNNIPLKNSERENLFVLRILKSMAKSLDAHTSFFSGQEAYEMRVHLEKGFHGIGVILQEGLNGVVINRLIAGGPAEKSSLIHESDVIAEINKEDITGYSFKEVLELIRGKKGSVITLGLIRDGKKDKILHVDLRRDKVVLDDKRVDVTTEKYSNGIIGKIVLHSFYEGEDGVSSENDVRKAILQLRKEGRLKGLVLDLRENLGGFLMQAVKVAGLFITNGVVVAAKYSDEEVKYFRDIDGYSYFDGPIVVLVSKASASAAEIVAQAMQDYGVAVVVGDDHTYGKGSIQHQTITDEDSETFFKVTVGRYYTVSGRSTQINGVKSDIVVPTHLYHKNIGEAFLDYPIPSDVIFAAYDDDLADLSWSSKRWYIKYYMPSLQKQKNIWRKMLPDLREMSMQRLQKNSVFQGYLKDITEQDLISKKREDDHQIKEAVNILNDMIRFQKVYEERPQITNKMHTPLTPSSK
jgi:carboxyl-terminal processing protease